MLVSGHDAQTLRNESRQLRHNCRNIMTMSVLLKEVSDDLVTVSKDVLTAVRRNRLLRIKDSIKELKNDIPR